MSSNHYQNLLAQAEKLYRHNRQGSYKTRERYFEAYKRFLSYLAKEFRLEKVVNISGKHLCAYVQDMQQRGLSSSTIKTDLAAIRFWHDQIPQARYPLPGNEECDLEQRHFGGVDRSWSVEELEAMLRICHNSGHEDYAACLLLARYAGLRLHEVMRIDTATARNAIALETLIIKGKGGKVREVPLQPINLDLLEHFLSLTTPGQKLFVPQGKPTHIAKTELQNFIRLHRFEVAETDRKAPLTFHGLRHRCAAEWYSQLLRGGATDQQAKLQVSRWLGHEREDVTRIYLASLEEQNE